MHGIFDTWDVYRPRRKVLAVFCFPILANFKREVVVSLLGTVKWLKSKLLGTVFGRGGSKHKKGRACRAHEYSGDVHNFLPFGSFRW